MSAAERRAEREEKLQEAYRMGLPYRGMADYAGCAMSTALRWCRSKGLPPNGKPGSPPNLKMRRLVFHAVEAGKSDVWVARQLGVGQSAVCYCRQVLGLDPAYNRKWTAKEERRAAYLWAQGLTATAIGKQLGRSTEAVKTRMSLIDRTVPGGRWTRAREYRHNGVKGG